MSNCDGTPECQASQHDRACWKWRSAPMTTNVLTCPCAVCGSQRRELGIQPAASSSTGDEQ